MQTWLASIVLIMLAATGAPRLQSNSMPIEPNFLTDIDKLADERSVRTEAGARSYVDALFGRFGIDEQVMPFVRDVKRRLSRGEVISVSTGKVVPESAIADAFNELVRDFGLPARYRITVREVHYARHIYSALIPQIVSRDKKGKVSAGCRPAEAVFVLFLLQSSGGVSDGIKEAASRDIALPDMLVKGEADARLSAKLVLSSRRLVSLEFESARDRYFLNISPGLLRLKVDSILHRFGVPG